jgi:hypothetical protein
MVYLLKSSLGLAGADRRPARAASPVGMHPETESPQGTHAQSRNDMSRGHRPRDSTRPQEGRERRLHTLQSVSRASDPQPPRDFASYNRMILKIKTP